MLYTDGEKVFYFLVNTQIKTKLLSLLKHESGDADWPWLSVGYLRRNEGNVEHNSLFLCHKQIQPFSVHSQSQPECPPPPKG